MPLEFQHIFLVHTYVLPHIVPNMFIPTLNCFVGCSAHFSGGARNKKARRFPASRAQL